MIRSAKNPPRVLFIRNVFKTDCIGLNTALESNIIDEQSIGQANHQIPIKQHWQDQQNYTYNTNLLESTSMSYNTDYQKNPKQFKSLDMWPNGTNLHCWYCFNQFMGPPKFVPLVVEPNTHTEGSDKYSIVVEANCCRWPCCKSFIKESTKDVTRYIEKCSNLYFLYSIWHGSYPKHIPEAPSKFLQKQFGGDLTTEEYYKLYNEIEEHGSSIGGGS